MCGIAGFLNLNNQPASPVLLKKMTDAIKHRGPDGEGFYVEAGVGLGHRRLAIIDLSPAGHQPMVSSDDKYVITYNGEVYNFQELRLNLEAKGYKFRSKTDSEVVLNSYMEWGCECVKKFNGMFAFVIWDKVKKQLFIARDRYGIKPLYYTFIGDKFVFASEQKAILADPAIKRDVDVEALYEYLTFQNIFSDRTLIKNIKMFPTATYGVVKLGTSNFSKLEKYWDYNFVEDHVNIKEADYVEELDRLFNQAVERQLVSDVDVGAYLSGGLDSGCITAIAAKELPYIKTFTCGFDLNSASGIELAFDERVNAEYLSYLFKTEHYEMVLKSGDMERILPKFAYCLEEPRVGQSYPNYYAAQLASKFVKVVLSGTGGDELFGGYPWRYYHAATSSSSDDFINKYYKLWNRLIDEDSLHKVFGPVATQVKHIDTKKVFKDTFKNVLNVNNKETSPEDFINYSLYFEAKTFLHGLLVVEDKLSMAHSLETRVPFLDNDLVDFAMSMPVRFKLNNIANFTDANLNMQKSFEKTKDGKLLLRKVANKYVPSTISDARKQGFSAPDASWFKGESIDYVRKIIFNDHSRLYDYLDRNTIKNMVSEHLNGEKNRRLLIWSLLNLENWMQAYIP